MSPSRSTAETYANVPDRPNPVSALNRVIPGINDGPDTSPAAAPEQPEALSGPTGPLQPNAGTQPIANPTPGAEADTGAATPARTATTVARSGSSAKKPARKR